MYVFSWILTNWSCLLQNCSWETSKTWSTGYSLTGKCGQLENASNLFTSFPSLLTHMSEFERTSAIPAVPCNDEKWSFSARHPSQRTSARNRPAENMDPSRSCAGLELPRSALASCREKDELSLQEHPNCTRKCTVQSLTCPRIQRGVCEDLKSFTAITWPNT